MALNGITLHALCFELNKYFLNGRIQKIAQPEKEELLITVKGDEGTRMLFLSANASLPLIYMTQEKKNSPMTAPGFCMVLRKHIGSGRITAIEQLSEDMNPGLERVIRFTVEHLDEMGDPAKKYIYAEFMGKHSNIIFCNSDNKIIDAIKHVGANVSSVREVLPGRDYFIPSQDEKLDPFSVTEEEFRALLSKPVDVRRFFSGTFTGFSSVTANEISERCGIDSDVPLASLNPTERDKVTEEFFMLLKNLNDNKYSPCIIRSTDKNVPLEYSAFRLSCYRDGVIESFPLISDALFMFYGDRNKYTNMHQKSADIRKNVQNILERNVKKLDLQQRQLKDTEKMDKFKLRGELLTANAYGIEDGSDFATVLNYYTNEEVKIPLDKDLTVMENANRYYEKYNKLKRTKENLTGLIKETEDAVEQLKSILTAIEFAENEEDLSAIKKELQDSGFIRFKSQGKGKNRPEKSKPLHFITDEGFHIYVGKNNIQNDHLTFDVAEGNDWWFHVKTYTGSHVIVKTEGKELPDNVFENAASLAGYYSSGRDSDKVEIDYLQKKNVKKPNKRNAGFVIYYTNYSMTVKPGIFGMREVKD